jgi:hypothetical protein
MPSFRSRLSPSRSSEISPHLNKVGLLLALLSPAQRRFILDPRRFKIARCTRRAGKTWCDAVYLILTCLGAPHTPTLYAGLTRDSAKEAIWGILIELLEQLSIPHTPRPSQLQIEFPNGSKITLFGCDAQNARNRLRSRKFKLIIFDETGFYASLDPLVFAVLPMLADYGGTLCLTSSPGELLTGLFYEADQGNKRQHWSQHSWSLADNPHFQKPALDPRYKDRAEEELAIILEAQYGGNADDPDFRREWKGEWVRDYTSLVYPIGDTNLIDAAYSMPEHSHVFGLDLSSPINHSLVVGRFSPHRREFQVIDQWKKSDLDTHEFIELVAKDVEKYDPMAIMAHLGDYSVDVIAEIRRRYRLPVIASPSKDIPFHQGLFSSDIQAGHVQFVRSRSSQLLEECGKLVRDKNGQEIEGQENSSANACLAAYRRVFVTHLSSYEKPLSEEDQMILQLENTRFDEPPPWMDNQENGFDPG